VKRHRLIATEQIQLQILPTRTMPYWWPGHKSTNSQYNLRRKADNRVTTIVLSVCVEIMPRLSFEARHRVISLYSSNYSVLSISQRLEAEKVPVTTRALYNLVKKFHLKGTIKDLPCCKTAQILTEEMKRFMEEKLCLNDEITATTMKNLLLEKWPDLRLLIPIIKCVHRNLDWVCTRPHYYVRCVIL